MPMKWDAQSDQKLLLKILEAHPTLAVDVAKVAEIWPEAGDGVFPTPRAIKERLGTIRKQAGNNIPIRTTGSKIKLKEITRLQAETQDVRGNQRAIHIKDEFEDTEMPATQTPLPRKLNFIRSSFSTPYRRSAEEKSKNTGGKNRRKRRISDSSDEDEAMSSCGSEFGADIIPVPEQESRTRSSKRRRITKPKYDLKDVQTSTDDERQPSDESDGGYNPVLEYEKDTAKREKRGRPHKAGRLGEVDAEEA